MTQKPSRYKVMERYMTCALCLDIVLFVLFLIFAGNGIGWLKVISALLCFAMSGGILWFLYTTKELLRQRSLWISMGAFAIIICLLFSLLLNFPSPNHYKQEKADSAYSIVI